jgi:amidohydrolase
MADQRGGIDVTDNDAAELRRAIHAHPGLSGHERETADRIAAFLRGSSPDEVVTELGGAGLAVVYDGHDDGPTVLLRAELDALPVPETGDRPHRSLVPGVSHACGHDGHAATLAAVGARLDRVRPARGRVVLLFQPAEETGQGARAVVDDPAFSRLRPDLAFALHNLPGLPFARVFLRTGAVALGSVAAAVRLVGQSAQAAYPEQARSPALATSALIEHLAELAASAAPDDPAAVSTVTHARLGERALGTTPGEAEIVATVRAGSETSLRSLRDAVERLVETAAEKWRLDQEISWEEEFPVTANSDEAVAVVSRAARRTRLDVEELEQPFRWSEDFGWFGKLAPAALIGLGAGEDVPPLHHTSYDFPDDLITPGANLLHAITQDVLGPYGAEEPIPH